MKLNTSDYLPSDSSFYFNPHNNTTSDREGVVFVEESPCVIKMIMPDPSQLWYWQPEWQKMEKEADQNWEDGDYEDFDSVDGFLASL